MISVTPPLTTDTSCCKRFFLKSPEVPIGRSKIDKPNSSIRSRLPNIQRAFSSVLTTVLLFTSRALAKVPDAQKCFANVDKTAGVGVTYSFSEPLSPLIEQVTLCNFSEVNCFEIEPYFDDFYTCNYTSSSELTVATFGLTRSESNCVYENVTKTYCQPSIQNENTKISVWIVLSIGIMFLSGLGLGCLYFRWPRGSIFDVVEPEVQEPIQENALEMQ